MQGVIRARVMSAVVSAAVLMVILVSVPGVGPVPARAQTDTGTPAQTDTGAPAQPDAVTPAQPAAAVGEAAPLQVAPGSETFTDPSSNIIFPTALTLRDGDREYRMKAAGSGQRKKLVVKVYGAALYVDETADLGSDPLAALVTGNMARRIVMTFKRGVDYGKIREAYEGGLKKVWKGTVDPAVAPELETFLHYFEGGVKEGQSIELTYLPDRGLFTAVAGKAYPLVTNAKIAGDIWAVWLGSDPVSSDLRRDLVRFLTTGKEK